MDYVKNVLNAGWLGSLLGLIGIALAFVFFLRSKTRPNISYQTHSVRLIGGAGALPPEIDITYQGKQIEKLTRTTCVFWNSGNTTIDAASIVEEDPFRVTLCSGHVLSADIIAVTRSVIAVNANVPENNLDCAVISFKFLDPGDGAIVALLHTAQEEFALVAGTIKGLPKGYVDRGEIVSLGPDSNKRRLVRRVLGSPVVPFAAAFVGVYMIGMGLLFDFNAHPKGLPQIPAPGIIRPVCVVSGLLYFVMSWRSCLAIRRRWPEALIRAMPRPEEKDKLAPG